MMAMWSGLVLLVALQLACSADVPVVRKRRDDHLEPTPEFYTSEGNIRGVTDHTSDGSQKVHTFLGIPYASPPTGKGRFEAPQPPMWHNDVLDASRHKARCPHRPIPSDPPAPEIPTSEDCLYLDIYLPDGFFSEKLPVMFFLHGGGYYGGSGSLYNFKNLAAHGVIVVTVNFRLDALGFLSTQDDMIPGNYGLKDAVAALKWVRNNIDYFGGDTSRITAFGGSSGAAMVSIMMLNYETRTMFSSAILQSGVAMADWAVHQDEQNKDFPKRLAYHLGKELGCEVTVYQDTKFDFSYDSWALKECLVSQRWDVLTNTSVYLQEMDYASKFGQMIWLPTFNTDELPEKPIDLLQRSWELDTKPTIYGFTAQDGSWLVPTEYAMRGGISLSELTAFLDKLADTFYPRHQRGEIIRRVKEAYLKDAEYRQEEHLLDALVQILTDMAFAAPTVHTARLFSKGMFHENIYLYQFDYNPSWLSFYPPYYGVGHASEKPFVLGMPNDTIGYSYPNADSTDHRVARLVTTMWANFAKYHNPTPTPVDGVMWDPYRPATMEGEEEYLQVISDYPVKMEFGIRKQQLQVWIDDIVEWETDGAGLVSPSTSFVTLMTLMVTLAAIFTFRP